MVKRKTEQTTPEETRKRKPPPRPSSASKGWGGSTVHARIPSGIPLKLEEDSEALLKFIGTKDIQERVADADGPVLYMAFSDGAKVVSMAVGYALSEALPNMEVDGFYHIHNQGEVEIQGRNPLKDLDITYLGKAGDKVDCPAHVCADGKIELSMAAIAEANYQRLNYPLAFV